MLWNAARIARHSQAFAASRMRLTTLRCALKAPCPAHNSRSYELLRGDAFCHILSYSVPGPASTSLDNRSSVSNSPYCPCTRGVMPRTSTLHELLCLLSFKMFKIQDTHSQHIQHTLSIQAVITQGFSQHHWATRPGDWQWANGDVRQASLERPPGQISYPRCRESHDHARICPTCSSKAITASSKSSTKSGFTSTNLSSG